MAQCAALSLMQLRKHPASESCTSPEETCWLLMHAGRGGLFEFLAWQRHNDALHPGICRSTEAALSELSHEQFG